MATRIYGNTKSLRWARYRDEGARVDAQWCRPIRQGEESGLGDATRTLWQLLGLRDRTVGTGKSSCGTIYNADSKAREARNNEGKGLRCKGTCLFSALAHVAAALTPVDTGSTLVSATESSAAAR